jgi:hypothetical protein
MRPDREEHSLDTVKLQRVMFFEGLRSERKLVRVAADRLSVRRGSCAFASAPSPAISGVVDHGARR